jgi:hypothetical protein
MNYCKDPAVPIDSFQGMAYTIIGLLLLSHRWRHMAMAKYQNLLTAFSIDLGILLLSTAAASPQTVNPGSHPLPHLQGRLPYSGIDMHGIQQRDSLNMRVAGRWPFGPSHAVAIDPLRHIAYLGSSGGIYILNVEDPAEPLQLSEFPTPGSDVLDLGYSNDFLYVADWDEGLRIYSVADPGHPFEIGSHQEAYHARGLELYDSYLLLAAGESLEILSVEDPSNPVEVGDYYADDATYGVALKGQYAYLAAGYGGLKVISVSDPRNPVEVGFYDTQSVVRAVALRDTLAYLADLDDGIRILSVKDPANPVQVGAYDTDGGAYQIALGDSLLYLADGGGGVSIISVRDPGNPVEIGHSPVTGWAVDIAYSDSLLYVSDDGMGLRIISVSNPSEPADVGSFESPLDAGTVKVMGDLLYVLGARGLRILSIGDVSGPSEVGNYVDEDSIYYFDIATDSTLAYIAAGTAGVKILSIEDPLHPVEIASHATPDFASDVAVDGAYAFVANGTEGLRILSVQDPSNPFEVSWIKPEGLPEAVVVRGDYAYVAAGYGGLRIISVSDPASPHEVGYYDTPHGSTDVEVKGSYAYLADSGGTRIISIEDPAHPFEVGYFDTEHYTDRVRLEGSVIFINYTYLLDPTGYAGGVQAVSVADPANPVELGAYHDIPGWVGGIDLKDSYVFAAEGQNGVIIFEYYGFTAIDDPGIPGSELPKAFSLSQNYPNPFNPATNISFEIPGAGLAREHVTLAVYDIRGRCMKRLVNSRIETGRHTVVWDGRNEAGAHVPSGVYLLTLKWREKTHTRKMVLLQ